MKKKKVKEIKRKIDPEREMAFKSLPPNIKNVLTDEEKELFLYEEVWPDELFEKLSGFLTPFKS